MRTFRLWGVLSVLVLAALACNAPGREAEATPEPNVIVVTPTKLPATAIPGGAVATPTQPPVLGGPHFDSVILFSETSDTGGATRTFTEGVEEIFALWNYSGMTQGLIVERVWYRNGDEWIKREEPWDFAKYGASGTVKDISIYDREVGLPPGKYELQLSINGQPQFDAGNAIDQRSFEIVGSEHGAGAIVPSRDGSRSASIQGKFIQITPSGRAIDAGAVVDWVDWLPDNIHLAYSTYFGGDGSGNPNLVKAELWMVNTDTGGTTKLSQEGERLHYPVVSPDGKMIAALRGTGYGDACGVDLGISFIQLDAALARVGVVNLFDFAGLSNVDNNNNPDGQVFPVTSAGGYLDGPAGTWQSSSQFKTSLRWTCSNVYYDGVYLLDPAAKSFQKVSELPKP
jgi:hypothetical protein